MDYFTDRRPAMGLCTNAPQPLLPLLPRLLRQAWAKCSLRRSGRVKPTAALVQLQVIAAQRSARLPLIPRVRVRCAFSPPGGDPRSQSRSLEGSLVTRCSTPTGAARGRTEWPQLHTQSQSAFAPPAAYLNHQIPTSDERPRLSNTPCCSLPPLLPTTRCQPVIWLPARCPSSPQAHAHTHRTLHSAFCTLHTVHLSCALHAARRHASARTARPDSPLHTRQASITRSKSRRLQSPWQ